MSDGQTLILGGNRETAHRVIDVAPVGSVLNVKPPRRTLDQNAKLWAMLSDISRAKPEGRSHPVHVWKALAMDMAGCKPQWERSLDGQGIVCVGYKSSRLTKSEMSDVLEAMNAYAAEHGIALEELPA